MWRDIQFGCERLRWNKSLFVRLLREHILIVTCLTKLHEAHVSNCSDIRPTWPSAAAAATALHPVSITSHRKPARKMSLKSESVPFSDLSPGLSREMLQWRQYAPDADPGPTRRVGNIYTRAWAVVHHHGGGLMVSIDSVTDTAFRHKPSHTFIVQSMMLQMSKFLIIISPI